MKEVVYLVLPNGERLISLYRHNFKNREINGQYYMIDGGQDGYIRYSLGTEKPKARVVRKPIAEEIEWLREIVTFKITKNYKGGNIPFHLEVPLKQLDKGNLITYFKTTSSEFIKRCIEVELIYRVEHNVKPIPDNIIDRLVNRRRQRRYRLNRDLRKASYRVDSRNRTVFVGLNQTIVEPNLLERVKALRYNIQVEIE